MFQRTPEAADLFFRWTELDRTSYPEFRDRIARVEAAGVIHEARSYAGYPKVEMPRTRPRRLTSLEATLRARRSHRQLSPVLPPVDAVARILEHSHGVNAGLDRGPVPSGGGLQALELYVVSWAEGWLETGAYHYDRRGHHLSRIVDGADRERWAGWIPSMIQFTGGGLLWVLVGDGARVERKYGPRARRFLLLEAGHLMQNLCLVSESLGLCTLPLGGFFERDVARELRLPEADVVLYLGVCGRPEG
ncbi:MAG: SagB/ThcOx family dehydrogenase [Planctomycetes bacterium]|nr:SagB/ThcOx family dehydrogenase [Planctomycetota bacterium]